MASTQKLIDLVTEAQSELDAQNYGRANAKLSKLTTLLVDKVIKKQASKAGENTQKIREALAAFKDKDPDEIAAELLAQGHRGARSSLRRCPMARYLSAADGQVLIDGIFANFDAGSVLLDENVQQFVHRFDRGAFPDLVDPDQDRWA
jgi:hypothetical protein